MLDAEDLKEIQRVTKNLNERWLILENNVPNSRLKSFVLDCIKTWWENDASVYIPRERKYYPKKDVFDAYSSNIRDNRERIERLEQNPNITENDIKRFIQQSIEIFVQKEKYRLSLQKHEGKLTILELKLDDVVLENNKLRNEIENLKRQSNTRQITKAPEQSMVSGINVQQNIGSHSSGDRIIEIFNEWARNPKPSLPSNFSYTDGELKLREKQSINNAGNDDSLWIVYKSEQIKLLFPNPNVIDQIGGDIDALYTVTGTRKAKGQNRVAIQKACEIKEGGWIEYKGALSLL